MQVSTHLGLMVLVMWPYGNVNAGCTSTELIAIKLFRSDWARNAPTLRFSFPDAGCVTNHLGLIGIDMWLLWECPLPDTGHTVSASLISNEVLGSELTAGSRCCVTNHLGLIY